MIVTGCALDTVQENQSFAISSPELFCCFSNTNAASVRTVASGLAVDIVAFNCRILKYDLNFTL